MDQESNLLYGIEEDEKSSCWTPNLTSKLQKKLKTNNKPKTRMSTSQPKVKTADNDTMQIQDLRNKRQSRFSFKGLKGIHKPEGKVKNSKWQTNIVAYDQVKIIEMANMMDIFINKLIERRNHKQTENWMIYDEQSGSNITNPWELNLASTLFISKQNKNKDNRFL